MSNLFDGGSKSYVSEHGTLVSYCLHAPGLALLPFLSEGAGKERVYWENQRDPIDFAGVGVAAELIAWGDDRFRKIQNGAAQLFEDNIIVNQPDERVTPRLFGGFSFQDALVTENAWASFSPAHFILPHFQLTNIDNDPWLIINAIVPLTEDPNDVVDAIKDAVQERYRYSLAYTRSQQFDVPEPTSVRYPMSYDEYIEMITRATTSMKEGPLKKVVLARISELNFDRPINLDYALSLLEEQYPNCYRFLFEPRPQHAFFGATPELLIGVNTDYMTSMGLAGSIKRGATPEEDAVLAQQILNDPKERYEHDLVVQRLRERLEPLTTNLDIPDTPTVLQLGNIQHLYTPVEGMLRKPEGILPLIENLHPTPALGGSPRDMALEFIADYEPAPRGWYAAPIGWIDASLDGEFGVAIRSAVAQDRRAWLYAGGGIVADSVPEREWNETALKFKPMLNALGVEKLDDVPVS